MKLLRKEQQKSNESSKIYFICKGKFEKIRFKGKKYYKVRDHCAGEYRGAPYSICNLKFRARRSNQDCHFIIKELAKKFES